MQDEPAHSKASDIRSEDAKEGKTQAGACVEDGGEWSMWAGVELVLGARQNRDAHGRTCLVRTLDISEHHERRKPTTTERRNSHPLCAPMASSSPGNAWPKSAHRNRALFGSLAAFYEGLFEDSKASS